MKVSNGPCWRPLCCCPTIDGQQDAVLFGKQIVVQLSVTHKEGGDKDSSKLCAGFRRGMMWSTKKCGTEDIILYLCG